MDPTGSVGLGWPYGPNQRSRPEMALWNQLVVLAGDGLMDPTGGVGLGWPYGPNRQSRPEITLWTQLEVSGYRADQALSFIDMMLMTMICID